MGVHQQIGIAPAPAVMAILSRFDRPTLEAFLTVAVDLLDLADGDPDIEETGDDQDGSLSEEEPAARFAEMGNGPGCDVADTDEGIDERPHDGIDEDREHEEDCHPAYGIDQAKGPLPATMTPDHVAMRKHLDRIHETRCEQFTYRNPYTQRVSVEFRLKD